MQNPVWRRLERNRASLVTDLIKASTERHHRYGHAGHLLEPNLRDSAGGLRDINTLGWAAKIFPGGDDLAGLVEAGRLSEIDAALVEDARAFVLRLRIELHLLTGRHQDQLHLAEQDDIATRLGATAEPGRPAADRLMQTLYSHARQVDSVVSSFWDRASRQLRKRRWRTASSENVGDGCVVQEHRLEVVATTHVAEDPAGWLRVFRRAALLGVPVGRATINRLHEELADARPPTWSDDTREVFVDLIEAGDPSTVALEAMDLAGLLVALFPEWAPIRAYPQRDLYHRYTVDRHLFAAVAELARSRNVEEADVRDAWSRAGDPDALFVAALLHDVGKGRPEDHSALGARIARDVAERMGLDAARCADVEFLVREHLVLAETAMRRDLNDPRTIEEIAERLGDVRRLAMLYLLTRADSLATGAEAWSSFRASLVRELYSRARARLTGTAADDEASASQRLAELADALGLEHEEAAALVGPMPNEWALGLDVASARRQLELLRTPLGPGEVRTSVHHAPQAGEFIVVAGDRPGLFSTVAGVLALRGIDVHDAEIYTRSDGVAVEIFRVMSAHGAVPEERWARAATDITEALEGRLDLDTALARRSAEVRRRRGHRRTEVSPEVVIDNSASERFTVVEVHTADRFGLLRLITKTLAANGCDLGLAKIATYGLDVVDAFYVRDLEGRKISDADDIRRIESALHAALTRGDGRPADDASV
jgi:[protein-PII] uridylyltransferase